MNRALQLKVQACSPMNRHKTKIREIFNNISIQKNKLEKENKELFTKNQMILKQIVLEEMNYIKSLCKPDSAEEGSVTTEEETEVVEPEVVVEDDVR